MFDKRNKTDTIDNDSIRAEMIPTIKRQIEYVTNKNDASHNLFAARLDKYPKPACILSNIFSGILIFSITI